MLQNIPKEKILEVVKEGPTIPARIVKRVGGDTMLIGAILSTLINTGQVQFSSLKIGGSPIYYYKGDESKLEQFTEYINEKDRKSLSLLKEHTVLQDSVQDPLTRVSLRTLKDFCKQFELNLDGKKELFWRYYLFDVNEATKIAEEILHSKQTSENLSISEPVEDKIIIKKISAEADPAKSEISTSKKQIGMPLNDKSEMIIQEKNKEKDREHAKKINTEKTAKEDFFEQIKKHVHNLKLDIISKEKLKKTEYDLVLKNHDTNEYIFCKAKDKKSITDGDLASAFVFAQSKKMPCVFITTGNPTKKATSMLTKEFKEIRMEQIE